MCLERSSVCHLTLPFPDPHQRLNTLVHFWRTDLPDKRWRHQVVDQIPIILEPGIRRHELDMLLRQNPTNQFAEETRAIKVLGAALQDVLAFMGVGDDDPGQGKGLDEGLGDWGGMAGCERCEPTLFDRLDLVV
jgi:hypothetical protein